jgi:receptor protein-tyrosine kinase
MIDETSRKLIERAAAHLRGRGQAPAEPAPSHQTPAYQEPILRQPAEPAYREPVLRQPEPAYQEPALRPSRPQAPQPEARAYGGSALRQPAEPAYQDEDYDEPAPQAAPQTYSRQVSIDKASLARHGITVPSTKRSRASEEFRIVKRQVVGNYMDEAADDAMNRNRVIMVTSARPREGKTFTAINLALAIATEQDLKVLLIDLDTKRHAMQEMMGIPANYGLTDLLSNPEIDFSEVVLRTNLPNLTVMPAGTPNIRSPELLSSKRTRAMFAEMTQRYSDRFIVFDAPSVLASSDPAVLAGLVGQVLLVIEADHTQQEEVETAVGLVSACPNVSLLLNKIRTSAADQFGSYSDY